MGPVWCVDAALRNSKPFDEATHAPLRTAIADALNRSGVLIER